MDYRALAELVMLSMMGLSVFVVAVGFSVRAFLAPTLRELFGKRSEPDPVLHLLPGRLQQLEERLDSIEHTLDGISDATAFDRALKESSEG